MRIFSAAVSLVLLLSLSNETKAQVIGHSSDDTTSLQFGYYINTFSSVDSLKAIFKRNDCILNDSVFIRLIRTGGYSGYDDLDFIMQEKSGVCILKTKGMFSENVQVEYLGMDFRSFDVFESAVKNVAQHKVMNGAEDMVYYDVWLHNRKTNISFTTTSIDKNRYAGWKILCDIIERAE
jgi:hypothetical protein